MIEATFNDVDVASGATVGLNATVPAAGEYDVLGYANWEYDTAGGNVCIGLYLNGQEPGHWTPAVGMPNPPGTYEQSQQCAWRFAAEAGDTVTLYLYQDNPGAASRSASLAQINIAARI